MKKLIAILLSMAVCFASFVGCTGDTNSYDSDGNVVTDSSKILDISVWNAGYGINWLNALATQYKKDHPGIAINIVSKSQDDFMTTIASNANANTTDLYFNYAPDYLNYTNYLEPLDSLVNAPAAANETKTIGEKFGEETMSVLTYNGTTYALTYTSGASGIVYNDMMFKSKGLYRVDDPTELFLPRTTEEMKELCLLIEEKAPEYKATGSERLSKGMIMHYPGYWQTGAVTWWLQYSGAEEFSKFFTFEGLSGTTLSADMQKVYQQEGMEIALNALREIIAPTSGGVTYKQSNDTSEGAFAEKQLLFITQNVALMYPCGGWLETEVEKNEEIMANYPNVFDNFKMMRYPVISALANKFENPENRTDAKLSELVAYVDAVAAGDNTAVKPSWATDNDVTLVKNARFASTGQTASSTVCIPKYAEAKALAKDFLKFVYSDAGLKIFAETQRNFMALDFDDPTVLESIDQSSWSNFSKSVYEISKNNISVPQNLNHPIRYVEGLKEIFNTNQPEKAFTHSQNPLTVQQFLDNEWKKFSDDWKLTYYKYFN